MLCKRSLWTSLAAIVAVVALTIAGAPAVEGSAPKAKAAGSSDTKEVVDLNAAGAEQLATVPGIGDSIAKRIVDFREKNGPFQSVDDLLKVQS